MEGLLINASKELLPDDLEALELLYFKNNMMLKI